MKIWECSYSTCTLILKFSSVISWLERLCLKQCPGWSALVGDFSLQAACPCLKQCPSWSTLAGNFPLHALSFAHSAPSMQLVFSSESLHKLLFVKNFHVTLTSFAYQLLLWRAPYLPPHAMPGQPEFRLILALFNPEMNFTLIQEPDVIFSNLSNGQNCVLLLHCYIMVLCYTLQLAGPALLRHGTLLCYSQQCSGPAPLRSTE